MGCGASTVANVPTFDGKKTTPNSHRRSYIAGSPIEAPQTSFFVALKNLADAHEIPVSVPVGPKPRPNFKFSSAGGERRNPLDVNEFREPRTLQYAIGRQRCRNRESLVDIFEGIASINSDNIPFFQSLKRPLVAHALETAVGEFDRVSGESGVFRHSVFPVIVEAALTYPSLFLDDNSKHAFLIDVEVIQLSRMESFSILACAFLGLFPTTATLSPLMVGEGVDDDVFPNINMTSLLFSAHRSDAIRVRMMLDYFETSAKRWATAASDRTSDLWRKNSGIRIRRSTESRWTKVISVAKRAKWISDGDVRNQLESHPQLQSSCGLERAFAEFDQSLIAPEYHQRPMDAPQSASRQPMARVVEVSSFDIGLDRDHVLESTAGSSWIFWMYPELHCARLFHTPLSDNEAIVVCNVERFSSVRTCATMTFEYAGAAPPRSASRVTNEVVVAADPMHFGRKPPAVQLLRSNFLREIVKLSAGLQGIPRDTLANCEVAVGPWGCGPCGGDRETKFLIMWIACSAQGIKMNYFPDSSTDACNSSEWRALVSLLTEYRVTCGELTAALLDPRLPCLTSAGERAKVTLNKRMAAAAVK